MPKFGWSCLIENSTFPLLSISASLTTITENKLNKSKMRRWTPKAPSSGSTEAHVADDSRQCVGGCKNLPELVSPSFPIFASSENSIEYESRSNFGTLSLISSKRTVTETSVFCGGSSDTPPPSTASTLNAYWSMYSRSSVAPRIKVKKVDKWKNWNFLPRKLETFEFFIYILVIQHEKRNSRVSQMNQVPKKWEILSGRCAAHAMCRFLCRIIWGCI